MHKELETLETTHYTYASECTMQILQMSRGL
jgi:hypothetical protein